MILMHTMTAIAVAAIVWVIALGGLLFGLFKGHIPSDEGNMIFYLILQAAIPAAVFWMMMNR
jgi:hypothetical protein